MLITITKTADTKWHATPLLLLVSMHLRLEFVEICQHNINKYFRYWFLPNH